MSVDLLVTADGWLRTDTARYRCALGTAGVTADKHEGDHATPLGSFPLRRLFYRADRVARPATDLPAAALTPADGWCDDPSDTGYNRHITLPYRARAETLYRTDHLYDYVVVIGHNDDPVVPGKGSAIFLHVAAPDYAGTEGCVALAPDDLHAVLPVLDHRSRIVITDAR